MKAYLVKADGINVDVTVLNVDDIRGATVVKNGRSQARTGNSYRIYEDFVIAKERAIESMTDAIENLQEQLLKAKDLYNRLEAINETDLEERKGFFT